MNVVNIISLISATVKTRSVSYQLRLVSRVRNRNVASHSQVKTFLCFLSVTSFKVII